MADLELICFTIRVAKFKQCLYISAIQPDTLFLFWVSANYELMRAYYWTKLTQQGHEVACNQQSDRIDALINF